MISKKLIAYIPAVIILLLAGFDASSLGLEARKVVLIGSILFVWGALFTAVLTTRYAKKSTLKDDGFALANLMAGSGIYMLNCSLLAAGIVGELLVQLGFK